MKSFFGYPGGKSRLAARWEKEGFFKPLSPISYYVEPFAGGFSMGLTLLKAFGPFPVWLNDVDQDVAALWSVALRRTEEFCERIAETKVTLEMFYEIQERILNPQAPRGTILERALDKLLVHKLSYSNMGEMAATPVGGKRQVDAKGKAKKWGFDVRWNTTPICSAIRRVAKTVGKEFEISHISVFDLLPKIPANALVYLDPPYVEAGEKCYKHFFTDDDHRSLARDLKGVKWRWFMTYDNAALVRELYPDAEEITLNYQMSSAYRAGKTLKPNTERLITNF
jgi:DNA adenine methylase